MTYTLVLCIRQGWHWLVYRFCSMKAVKEVILQNKPQQWYICLFAFQKQVIFDTADILFSIPLDFLTAMMSWSNLLLGHSWNTCYHDGATVDHSERTWIKVWSVLLCVDACSTETGSLGMFSTSSFSLECDAFRFQPLLSAVRSTSTTSEHVCSTLSSSRRGHMFIFNLTATLLFLDMLVQTIRPPALFRLFKREKKKKQERKELTWSCLYLFTLHKPRRTKAG